MNKYIGLTLITVAIVGTTGCASETMVTHIRSDPPGARVEVNENNVGVTPVDVTLPQRGPHHRLREHVTIRAYPAGQGQYVQEKQVYYNQWAPEDIVFNMNQSPGPSK